MFSMGILTVIQEAEANDATAISASSPSNDRGSEEILQRPIKPPRMTHEKELQNLVTRADASRQAVLQTNELLEGILSFLPPKQLFVVQRVCKQWRDIIASSPELQKKMFLRVDERPRHNWGLKVDYLNSDPSKHFQVRKFDNSPLPRPWSQVTPIILSPHLKNVQDDDEDFLGPSWEDRVGFELPCDLPIGSRISILDTYFSDPTSNDFTLYLDFKFEPAIPTYSRLIVSPVQFQTRKALRFHEVIKRAMAIRTIAELSSDCHQKDDKTEWFRDLTMTEIINKLQQRYECTALLCKSSMIFLDKVVAPCEQQWAEVDAAFVREMQDSK